MGIRPIVLVCALVGVVTFTLPSMASEGDRPLRTPHFAEVPQGKLGELLVGAIEAEEAIAGLLKSLSDETRQQLIENLDRAASISVIERLKDAGNGKTVFDPEWVPRVVVHGRSGGVLDEDGKQFYSITARAIDIDLRGGGHRRFALLDFELELIGLKIVTPVPGRSILKWQLDITIDLEEVQQLIRDPALQKGDSTKP